VIAVFLPLALALAAAPAPEPARFPAAGGWTIAASYRPPDGKRGRVVLLVHGVGAGKGEWDPLAQELWKRGIGTLAIDLRGHGESAARAEQWRDFDMTGEWPRCEGDLEAALAFLKKRGVSASRVGAVGGSIGANLVSQLAARHPELRFAALLSPGADYRGVSPASLKGRRVLVAASPGDAYAYQTARALESRDKARFLEAGAGHGAQLLRDPDFLKALVDWIVAK